MDPSDAETERISNPALDMDKPASVGWTMDELKRARNARHTLRNDVNAQLGTIRDKIEEDRDDWREQMKELREIVADIAPKVKTHDKVFWGIAATIGTIFLTTVGGVILWAIGQMGGSKS